MERRKDQPLSGSALALFLVKTSPGRRWAVGFIVGACLLGLLLAVTHSSDFVAISANVVYTLVAVALASRSAARYWADLEPPS